MRASRRAWPGRSGASVATRYTCLRRAVPGAARAYMANIPSQEKRIHRAERERLENRRRTSQVKTWFRRLESAVERRRRRDRRSGVPQPGLADRPGGEVGRAAPQQRRAQEGPRRAHPFAPFLTVRPHGARPQRYRLRAAMESDLSRREFLERTALAAGVAGSAALPASTLLAEAAQAHWGRNPLPPPRNIQIDHFVILMMENRSFDHYFGWLREADARQHQSYPDPEGDQVCRRATSPRSAPAAPSTRAAATPTPATAGTRAAPSSTAASWPRARATTSSRSPTSTRATWASSTRRPRSTRPTTATSARCSPRPGRTASTSGRRSPAG